MRRTLILLAVALLSWTAAAVTLAGPAGAMIGGVPETHGWAVRIEQDGRGICSGTMIRAQFVLTAAHCGGTSTPMYANVLGNRLLVDGKYFLSGTSSFDQGP